MIYELIAVERGHFYVCGDCKMAENVCQTLKSIIQEQAGMNSAQSDNFMLGLRVRWSACTRFMVVVGTVRRVGRNISRVFFFDFRICLSDAISIRMRGFFSPTRIHKLSRRVERISHKLDSGGADFLPDQTCCCATVTRRLSDHVSVYNFKIQISRTNHSSSIT